MKREQVEQILLIPPDYFVFDNENNKINWYWDAASHLDCLTKKKRNINEKGHYTLVITFNSEGFIEKKVAGVN
jgi:hypothetical protein